MILRFGLLIWCVLIDANAGPTALARGEQQATELVNEYNSRELGGPGIRQVRLEMSYQGIITRTFLITNVWSSGFPISRMLFYLNDPSGLRGTRYLQVEDPTSANELSVSLYLPAGRRRVLTIPSDLHGQGLLGSDFSYHDVRLRLPVRDCSYRMLGKTTLNGRPVWKIESVADKERHTFSWTKAVYYLMLDRPFLVGADYYDDERSHDAGSPTKNLRVSDYSDYGKVRTATRMTMTSADGRATTFTLKSVRFYVSNLSAESLTAAKLALIDESKADYWFVQQTP